MEHYVICTVLTLFVFIYAQECEDKLELHLATKTPYRIVANKNYIKGEANEGCVKKIWMLVRHGTRNPNVKQINKMQGHLPLLRDIILEKNSNGSKYIVKSDLDLFRKWVPRLEVEDEKKLTVEGENEMLELAERMQARFPDALPPIYSSTSYQFKFTKTQRTRKSAKYFAVGLFGKQTANDVYFPEAVKADPILRFYKLCSKWKNEIKNNISTYEEKNNFLLSPIMADTVKKINKKLGLKDILTIEDAQLIYTTCAFETAWTSKKKSPWCIAFDYDTIKVMEYAEDLKHYWVDGYAYNLTYNQACPTFGSLVNFLEDKNPHSKAVLYFTHSGTLLKFIGHLGLYKDEQPLRHNDFAVNQNRKWRVSKIDSFGNNFAFVLHECEGVKKVLVLHNENVIRLPCCPDSDLCELEVMKNYYSASSCMFNKMCENTVAPAA